MQVDPPVRSGAPACVSRRRPVRQLEFLGVYTWVTYESYWCWELNQVPHSWIIRIVVSLMHRGGVYHVSISRCGRRNLHQGSAVKLPITVSKL